MTELDRLRHRLTVTEFRIRSDRSHDPVWNRAVARTVRRLEGEADDLRLAIERIERREGVYPYGPCAHPAPKEIE